MPTSSQTATKRAARKTLDTVVCVFSALGDRTRLKLVLRLSSEGPLSISALAANAKMTRQAITKHLDVLQTAGLVRCRRSGREQIFSIDARRLKDARRQLKVISRDWDDALERAAEA